MARVSELEKARDSPTCRGSGFTRAEHSGLAVTSEGSGIDGVSAVGARPARPIASVGRALPQDTAEYITYRLAWAGCQRAILSSDAIAMIHEASSGHLRDIDRIATDVLKRGAKRGLKVADRELVEGLLEDEEIRRHPA